MITLSVVKIFQAAIKKIDIINNEENIIYDRL